MEFVEVNEVSRDRVGCCGRKCDLALKDDIGDCKVMTRTKGENKDTATSDSKM